MQDQRNAANARVAKLEGENENLEGSNEQLRLANGELERQLHETQAQLEALQTKSSEEIKCLDEQLPVASLAVEEIVIVKVASHKTPRKSLLR